MNLLAVEDDPRVADFLTRGLRAEGYLVAEATTGPEGLQLARSRPFDLILLDLMLPGLSGLELCRELRSRAVRTPILMLSALDTTEDKIKGLRLGADDYLAKPFGVDELLARIEALIRRSRGFAPETPQLVVGDLVFDRETLTARKGDRPVELTVKELALLELLMGAPGKVFAVSASSTGSGGTPRTRSPTWSTSTSAGCASSWQTTAQGPRSRPSGASATDSTSGRVTSP